MVVRSPMHATQQAAGLETRLRHAETTLAALTPPRGRGKRHITDEATLVEAIALVLKEYRVAGLLSVTWEKQVEQTTQYVGRGRGAGARSQGNNPWQTQVMALFGAPLAPLAFSSGAGLLSPV